MTARSKQSGSGNSPHAKYEVIECSVVRELPYGVALVDAAGARGYAEWDRTDFGGVARLPVPEPGTRLRGVVLGYAAGRAVLGDASSGG